MKFFFILFLAFFLLVSCSNELPNIEGPPYRAAVLKTTPIGVSGTVNDLPVFEFGIQSFFSLTNLNSLTGDYFDLKDGGELTVKSIAGSLVASDGFVGGHSPILRYRALEGAAIPKDYRSSAMLSAYYQFDWVAENLSTLVGFPITDMVEANGKFSILFEPKLRIDVSGSSGNIYVKTNAAYEPGGNYRFLIFKPSRLESVPLSANLQVISHEFGHALWEFLFDGGKSDKCERLGQEYAISGLNEGWSDYLSYVAIGSSNILSASFDTLDSLDQRDFGAVTWTYSSFKKDVAGEICQQSFYCIGTLFAKSLYVAATSSGVDQTTQAGRGTFALSVVEALRGAKAVIDMSGAYAVFTDKEGCASVDSEESTKTQDGDILGRFFKAFLSKVSDTTHRTLICNALADNFGTLGFPESYRGDGDCSL